MTASDAHATVRDKMEELETEFARGHAMLQQHRQAIVQEEKILDRLQGAITVCRDLLGEEAQVTLASPAAKAAAPEKRCEEAVAYKETGSQEESLSI